MAARAGCALIFVAADGCTPPRVFRCETSQQCSDSGVDGRCEASGYCSFPDNACVSGLRYGSHAGEGLAGQCVDEPVGATGSESTATTAASTSPVADGSTSAGTTDGTTTRGPTTSTGGSSTGGLVFGPPALIFQDSALDALVRVDLDRPVADVLCTGTSTAATALSWLPDGRLIGTNIGDVVEIDPCTCDETPLFPHDAAEAVSSLARDPMSGLLYGFSDTTVATIDLDAPSSTVEALPNPLANHGGAWSDEFGILVLDSAASEVLQFEIGTWISTPLVVLDRGITRIGFDVLPGTAAAFACDDAQVFTIDLESGETADYLDTMAGSCNNLTVQLTAIACE